MARSDKAPAPMAVPDKMPDTDHGLGEFYDPFPEARVVGQMAMPEAAEIKARNGVIARLSADIEHMARTRALVSNEKVQFIRMIGARFGLGVRDELTVDDETGAVTHTGRRRFVQPSEVEAETPAPPDEPAN